MIQKLFSEQNIACFFFLTKMSTIPHLRYSFFFVSLITPTITTNLNLFFTHPFLNKKIILKQSYVLLTWFYYLSFLISQKTRNAETNSNRILANQISIAVLPVKKKTFTLTRAPMAHRNWSKEQYKFQFYKFKISFIASLAQTRYIKQVQTGLLFILLSKQHFPNFETNLLLLKYYAITLLCSDTTYFNYFKFETLN